MLVHSNIACLPVQDERNDGVFSVPCVLDIESDSGILKEVVNDDEPSLHQVYRSGYAAVVPLSDGDTEPCVVRVIFNQAKTKRYTEPAEQEVGGCLDGNASGTRRGVVAGRPGEAYFERDIPVGENENVGSLEKRTRVPRIQRGMADA